jgi:hypothetical protein
MVSGDNSGEYGVVSFIDASRNIRILAGVSEWRSVFYNSSQLLIMAASINNGSRHFALPDDISAYRSIFPAVLVLSNA